MLNPHLFTSEKPLKVKLDCVDGNNARLVFSDNQIISINAKFLPKNAKKGDVLYLSIVSEGHLDLERGKVAKAVLDEILR